MTDFVVRGLVPNLLRVFGTGCLICLGALCAQVAAIMLSATGWQAPADAIEELTPSIVLPTLSVMLGVVVATALSCAGIYFRWRR